MDIANHKENFFEANTEFREIEPSNGSTTIGEFDNIDDLEDEIWLMQCPKGTDITAQLQGQKMKLPGRSHIDNLETVAVEFIGGQETHSFGYCNRKGRYALRLLPIRGSILLRSRLKANNEVIPEIIESNCSEPLPDRIKVRHPLLGYQFEEKLKVNNAIANRLRRADENLSEVMREAQLNKKKSSVSLKRKHKSKTLAETETEIYIVRSDSDDDDIQFLKNSKLKYKEKKSKQSENISNVTEDEDVQVIEGNSPKKHKSKKSKNLSAEDVSKDLQWLQQL